MAEKKKSGTAKSTADTKKATQAKKPQTKASSNERSTKKTGAAKNAPTRKRTPEPRHDDTPSFASQLTPYIIAVLAIFVGVCIYAGDSAGVVGGAIHNVLLGLNGGVAYVLPVLILFTAVKYSRDFEDGVILSRNITLGVVFIFVSMLFHIFTGGAETFNVATHWKDANAGKGGGAIGGLLGHLMLCAFGKAGSLVLIFAIMFVLILYVFGVTPKSLWILIRYKIKVSNEEKTERRIARLEEKRRINEERERYLRKTKSRDDDPQIKINTEAPEMSYPEPQKYKINKVQKKKPKFSPDVPIDDDFDNEPEEKKPSETPDEIDERIFEEAMRRTKARMAADEAVVSESENTTGKAASDTDTARDDVSVNAEDAKQDKKSVSEDVPEKTGETVEKVPPVEQSEKPAEGSGVDLKKIFVNPEDAELLDKLADAYLSGDAEGVKSSNGEETEDELTITRVGLGEGVTDETVPAPKKKEYLFPSVSILAEDTESRDENIKEELHANAVKLVETLKSFNVKTKIENVSRGPTITRYELLPEAGIRVRSILNLVDDIALNLATTGVRIEAPIPGKPAVGIEVPNKKRTTVHLRTLIEDERFANSQSKLICALGKDVGGENVYLDIGKMPHLLIAGATGMGKSVCINSLIVSLLYNANPDDVKLILIDPKKVELNIYNGIPHLLVPVVSDPKKAAGSLSWAVSEMERRFGLIESVGVRDVNMYNKVTANDPSYEYLPYIVIIIDELADLMMTAPDDVEESVCRLMQKARAAGMHIIIGTQRPSVDVITGLIKANIPSRIAFTVASQVDSRTIIDRAGAESLIGRGDMLYLPVGASKPIRVQGAFVSEEDVEEVVEYIKTANSDTGVEYSSEVIDQIEKAAAMCGAGKKSSGGSAPAEGGADDDPMLRQALELAVNSGKISTSLIQRRLSLGYGRAAKLIDRMEQLGYVSPPEGQKPREVLITKEQFMEMVVKNDADIM